MKQLLFCLSLMAFLLSAGSAAAQTGLKMNDLFEGRVIPQERMVETRVRGKSLATVLSRCSPSITRLMITCLAIIVRPWCNTVTCVPIPA